MKKTAKPSAKKPVKKLAKKKARRGEYEKCPDLHPCGGCGGPATIIDDGLGYYFVACKNAMEGTLEDGCEEGATKFGVEDAINAWQDEDIVQCQG